MTGPSPLEAELHRSFDAWVADHAQRIPEVSDIGYDRERYPAQRLEEPKTTGGLPGWVPSSVMLWILRRKLASVLRSREKADRMIEAFGDSAPQVARLLDEGKSIALLTGHSDNLFDIAYCLAGLQISFGTTRYVGRTGIIVNKLMTREAFRGKPMLDTLKLLCSVYWVIPDTESTRRWGVPEDAARAVNAGAMEAIIRDVRRGALIGVIPTGTAARHDSVDGQLQLTMPPISPGTARLLQRFDAFLPVAMWDDVAKPAPLCVAEERGRDAVNAAIAALAAATAELAVASVVYHEVPNAGDLGAKRVVSYATAG